MIGSQAMRRISRAVKTINRKAFVTLYSIALHEQTYVPSITGPVPAVLPCLQANSAGLDLLMSHHPTGCHAQRLAMS